MKKYLFNSLVVCLINSIISNGQNVDPFTGNLHYQVPLLTVPSPDGPGVPINANYQAGIRVNQTASEIGLGWFLDVGGEINRTIDGTPDDWKGVKTVIPSEKKIDEDNGLLYLENGTSYDSYSSEFKLEDEKKFYFLAKDQYYASGKGINGSLSPYLLNYGSAEIVDGEERPKILANTVIKKPQFSFNNEFSGNVNLRHYPWSAPLNNNSTLYLPGDAINGSTQDYDGVGYNSNENRLITPQYVEFFTNQQIKDHLNGTTIIQGFLEVSSGFDRNQLDPNGIGAFRVTDANGNVYHYSLPSYRYDFISGNYPMDYKYNLEELNESMLTKEIEQQSYLLKMFNFYDLLVEFKMGNPTSTQWLLTAITGTDFKDDGDGLISESDKGYWVSYEWQLWCDKFASRNPLYGFDYKYDKVHNNYDDKISGVSAGFNASTSQLYYLNRVKTATHSAILIRDIRNDEHSAMNLDRYHAQQHFDGNIARGDIEVNMPYTGTGPILTTKEGILYDHRGSNSNYFMGADGIITIAPENATYVTLNFDEFHVASPLNDPTNFTPLNTQIPPPYPYYDPTQDCNCLNHYVEIYDGPNTSSPLIGKFCGLKPSNTSGCMPSIDNAITSTTGAITLRMHVDTDPTFNFTNPGFKARWSSNGKKASSTAWTGTLYDDGGPTGNYGPNSDQSFTIAPDEAAVVQLDINYKQLGAGDFITLYDGPDQSSPVIAVIDNSTLTNVFSSTGNSLTVRFTTDKYNGGAGFEMKWKSHWHNQPSVTPQLKVAKLLLVRNEDLDNIAHPSPYSIPNLVWDLSLLNNVSDGIYHIDWFQQNEAQIKAVTLAAVDFRQDYSLSKAYHNNINVAVNNTHKLNTPSEIQSKLASYVYGESGKLTLNEIVHFGKEYIPARPSHLFNYNADNAIDNPDFDPRKKDYWGFWKNDADAMGVNGYRSATSATMIDAWSLRSITKPMGEEIEFVYESDQYSKQLSSQADGSYNRLSRFFYIKEATASTTGLGEDWNISLDNGTNEFVQLINNLPTGSVVRVILPFTTSDKACLYGTEDYITQGTGSITTTQGISVSGLSIYNKTTEMPISANHFNGCNDIELEYEGGGYVWIELPNNYTIYGGDLRVKEVISKNGAIDTYVKSYEYQNGVVTNQPDRFLVPKQNKDDNGNLWYDRLLSYRVDNHQLPSGVGYTTTVFRNKGQVGQSEGEIQYHYLTSDYDKEYYQPTTTKRNLGYINCANRADHSEAIEVTDRFSNQWGLLESVEVRDVNNTIISKTKNTYESVDEGAIVEGFHFFEKDYTGAWVNCNFSIDNHISILRKYPVRLLKKENFSKGRLMRTTYLSFDDITGGASEMKIEEDDGSVHLNTIKPAFRESIYAYLGPKSASSANKNRLLLNTEVRNETEKQIMGNNDFLDHKASTLSHSFYKRTYDHTTQKFGFTLDNQLPALSHKQYRWSGPLGRYGTYDQTSFVPFTHTGLPNSLWEEVSQVTLLDDRNHIIENKRLNNTFLARKFTLDDQYMMAEIANCNYASFTCSGFEDLVDKGTDQNPQFYFEGEISKIPTATQVVSNSSVREAHTGSKFLQLSVGTSSVLYKVKKETDAISGSPTQGQQKGLLTGRTYRASVWVHKDSPVDAALILEIEGSTSSGVYQSIDVMQKNDANAVQVGDWIRLIAEVNVPSDYESANGIQNDLRVSVSAISADAWFDDIRLHPTDAPLEVNVFDPLTGRIMATLDAHNFASKYDYNAMGNVIASWQEIEGLGWIKTNEQHYDFFRDLDQ